MSSVTDKQWRKWGKQNPYYGILGYETEGFEEEGRDAFFNSGKDYIDGVFADLKTHSATPKGRAKALDFGCGAGRLLLPISDRFDAVVGVDVSEDQLVLGAKTLEGRDARFVTNLGALESENGTFDFVNTFIVMQHIRPEQGYDILRRLVALVGPGGAFSLHFTIGDLDARRQRLNWLRYRFAPLHWAYNVRKGRPWNEPVTEMNRYDMATIALMLRQAGVETVGIRFVDHNSHQGAVMMGRKPA